MSGFSSPIRIIFLLNSNSNKSQTALSRFTQEWDLTDVEIACISDSVSGKANQKAQALDCPLIVCSDKDSQEATIKEATDEIGGCDYLISVGWTHRVPSQSLSMPKQAALNVHSSYLPNYKGLSVHRAQWANAEKEGGVTVHQMEESFDTGAIIAQQRYKIGLFDTPLTMTYTIGELSSALLREAIFKIEHGYTGSVQSDEGDYYSLLPWPTILWYGIINHIYRALRIKKRNKVAAADTER